MGRVKSIDFYNGGALFDIVLNVMKPLFKSKQLERVKFAYTMKLISKKSFQQLKTHSNLESLYKVIQPKMLPDEYLPDDYNGPSAGPCKKLAGN